MIRLGVNIDHVATLRQARRAAEPDPVTAAALAVLGGADGVTVHLREDRRHINDRDLHLIRQTVTCRLNLEMAATDEMTEIACREKPDEVTLVPEKRQELTTEGGLDVVANAARLRDVVRRLQDAGILVAVFIDPEAAQAEAAKSLGAVAVEVQTALYSEARGTERPQRLEQLARAARHAASIGLHVHMGHGLTYQNVHPVAALPEVEELNIGHSIVSRAVLVGLERAVRDMKELLRAARPAS
jgi:pyridoxine 5-phosphate synthase